jgi:hypothetical protein
MMVDDIDDDDNDDGEKNSTHHGDTIDYVNVPWGGVRETSFRDVLMSKKESPLHQDSSININIRKSKHKTVHQATRVKQY